jgi:hypothetical protein
MEFKNDFVERNFLEKDRRLILDYIDGLNVNQSISNVHIKNVASALNGSSYMFDISKSEISRYLSSYQSDNNSIIEEVPEIFIEILKRISSKLSIPKDNVFLQIIDNQKGGKIIPHYDSSIDGYINYKCNIAVLADDYKLYLDDRTIDVKEGDLYCFEASLYKHWTEPFNSRRVILSYGFALSYNVLNRREDDYRINLSKRIIKYFQK